MKALFLGFLISACAYPSDFFEIDKVPGENREKRGKSIKEIKSAQRENGFSAMIAITDELGIIQRWAKPSEGFSVKTAKEVTKGQYFLPLIFFSGAKKDGSGNTKVSYVLRVIKPDGGTYLEQMLEGWSGKPSPTMNLVKGYVKMCFDPPDSFGKYKYIAYVRDEIGNTQLTIESEVELVEEKKSVSTLLSGAELDKFLHFYYEHKNPKKLPIALQTLDHLPGFTDRNIPLMYFLEHVFANNPKMISNWEKDFSKLSLTMQKFIWDGMWLSKTSEGAMYLKKVRKNQNEKEKKYIDELMAKVPIILLNEPVLNAHDLDKNWISFFATGNPEYIDNIISGLDFSTSDTNERTLMKASASFSLMSNCRQHKKVKSILGNYIEKRKTRFINSAREVYKECLSHR